MMDKELEALKEETEAMLRASIKLYSGPVFEHSEAQAWALAAAEKRGMDDIVAKIKKRGAL